MNLFVEENWINATKGYRIGDSGVYETFTDNRGKLYRAMVREYGRCVGRVYLDEAGKTRAIGWVFQKRRQYEDCADTYLAETWVTIHAVPPTRTITNHYA